MTLTRDQILSADDRNRQTVYVPEWGGCVVIQQITALDRLQWEESCLLNNGTAAVRHDMLRAGLLVRCLVDDGGNKLFTLEDITSLNNKSASAINRVFEAALELNGIGKGDTEDLVGN